MDCSHNSNGQIEVRFTQQDTFAERTRVLAAFPRDIGALASVRTELVGHGQVFYADLPEEMTFEDAQQLLFKARTPAPKAEYVPPKKVAINKKYL